MIAKKKKSRKLKLCVNKVWGRRKRYIPFVLVVLFAILWPIILWAFGCWLPQFIHSNYDALLSYFGVLFGILGSFATYRAERSKEMAQRRRDLKPQVVVELEVIEKEIYVLRILNCGSTPLKMVYIEGEYVASRVEDSCTVNIDCREDEKYFYDFGNDRLKLSMIPDSDGYPIGFQVCCNDSENNIWALDFKKVCTEGKIYYGLESFSII